MAVPLGTEPLIRGADSSLDQRSSWWLSVVARLEPGVSPEETTSRLNARQPQIREATMPQNWRPEELKHYLNEPFSLRTAAAGSSSLRSRYAKPLTTMMGAVGLVLLIACANLLPGARSIYRWKEGVHDEREVVVLMKTRKQDWTALLSRLHELHPFDVPECVAVRVAAGAPKYMAWLDEALAPEAT